MRKKKYKKIKLTTGKAEATPVCDWVFCEAVGMSQSHLVTGSETSAACAFVLMASSTPFTMFESSVFLDLSVVHLSDKGLYLNYLHV